MRFSREDLASTKVYERVRSYLAKELPNYELLSVFRKSKYTTDDYLYEVEAKNKSDDSYTVWTCWNDNMQSMNHGHYGIASEDDCEKIMAECYWPPMFKIGDKVKIYTVREDGDGVIIDKGNEDGFWTVLTPNGYDTFGASELEFA